MQLEWNLGFLKKLHFNTMNMKNWYSRGNKYTDLRNGHSRFLQGLKCLQSMGYYQDHKAKIINDITESFKSKEKKSIFFHLETRHCIYDSINYYM